MCGIVGYIGSKQAHNILLHGLKKLEYRGYDSAGMACFAKPKIAIRRKQGKVVELERLLGKKPLKGTLGIAHTRWATHGAPSQRNTHPHVCCKGHIAVVHNGIIENYEDIKMALIKEGHIFTSETDTEIIPHLIEKFYKDDLQLAIRSAIKQLRGSFALGIIASCMPGRLFAVRSGSPLVIGIGDNEHYLASDVAAILPYTKEIIYLEDGDLAVLSQDARTITSSDGEDVARNTVKVDLDISQAEKGGYAHFMLKEIYEQPSVLEGILQHRLSGKQGTVAFKELGIKDNIFTTIDRITIVGCGTAYHAGLTGRYIFEKLLNLPVDVDVSSELRYRTPVIGPRTLVVAISQSGETADTLACIRTSRKHGATVLSIVNALGSSMTRESDGVLYTHAGPEIGVASTKAYTAQLGVLYLLGIYLGGILGTLSSRQTAALLSEMAMVPGHMQEILDKANVIKRISQKHKDKTCFLYLGRNLNFPNALEGALKLKEISYVHAEGYSAGEMKHGPIALVDKTMPIVCIAPQSDVYDKMISNIQEIKARGGVVISIATQGDAHIQGHSDYVVYIPPIHELFSPMLTVVPLQLLAYYIASANKRDVDQPRNLAKSVTVE
jgi:glutamine---fructose-6-phosphate transaminase (isomerizing)